MNLIKCKNGHYYNADKLDTCPHCAGENIKTPVADPEGKDQTAIDTLIPDRLRQEAYEKATNKKLTGWLVCISGIMEGDSFTLFAGDNHIGRDTNMDVCLYKEPTVSRCDHAIITYDNVYSRFTLHTDSASVLYNNKALSSGQHIRLDTHDQITLGSCTLSFIPFCGEHFQWDEEE